MADELENLLAQYQPELADVLQRNALDPGAPFGASPPPPAGYRGYDYKPTMTPADLALGLVPPGSGAGYASPRDMRANHWRPPSLLELLPLAIPAGRVGLPAPRVRPEGLPTVPAPVPPRPTFDPYTNIPPRKQEGFSLSANRAFEPSEFDYFLFRDGKPAGRAFGNVQDNIAHFDMIRGDLYQGNRVGSLGVRGLRQLREAMREDWPHVDTFQGGRLPGAGGRDLELKRAVAGWRDEDNFQSVKLPSLAAPAVAVPTLADLLSQYGGEPPTP